ncbi:MAG: CheR family methyltransferase, partial [Polyangiales bacterium]
MALLEEHDRRSMPPQYQGASTAGAPALVVGIGASAGGLEALREFFAVLEEGAGMAFIVVEHHDPSHTHLLTELLHGVTPLPVSQVHEGEPLMPNHVYVAPSDVAVELHGNVIHLAHYTGSHEDARMPIDALFRTLSESFGSRAVGIVLSGAGTDGTVGVQLISNEGGMTAAQEPEQAKYDSMPRSAISTGIIDHVMTAQQLAEALLAYVGHVQQLNAESAGVPDSEAISAALQEICELLYKATDHNFRHYKTTTLVRRIQRRMQVMRLATVDAYLVVLRENADEVTQLFRELLIGVTSFFRDPDAFVSLQQHVIAPLLQRRGVDQLRVWVPGCATGEEAYSLAIALREAMDGMSDPPEVQIFATDIDERALSVARQGVYPAGIAEDVTRERLERFFVKRGKRYQVARELRELCLFSPHNLINDPPFSRIDLISCRNLLIYFGPHLQTKLVPLFHYALRNNGYLFLGPSENISSHKDLFTPVDAKHRISQRKATAIRTSGLLSDGGSYRGSMRVSDNGLGAQPDLHQLMQRILLDEFSPKSVIVTEEGQIVSASGDMSRYLTVTEGTFQNNLVRLARPGLRVGLRATLNDAIKIRRKVVHDKVSVQVDSGVQRVRVTVQPMPRVGEESDLFLVVFQDLGNLLPREETPSADLRRDADSLIEQLERELSSTREDLEKSIQDLEVANEELKSSNEELLSMNEELQSANEELETSKEEVQASNEALARAHANLSNLLTSTAIATIFLDEQLHIQSFTPAVTDIYNLLPADIGRPLAHITHRAPTMPPLPNPAELRNAARVDEHDVVTPERWYLRRVRSYTNHEGRAEGIVVTFTDVTALKRAVAEARRVQRRLELITDALPVLISYVDKQQRYQFNNKAYERWFGRSREELRGKEVREILGPETYAVAQPHVQRALAGEATSYETELVSQEFGGRIVLSDYVPDRGSDGEVRGYFSLKQDVTEQRRASQALDAAKRAAESANRAKSDFLANMSHEIRTPMSAILGYTDLLLSHVADPDDLACIDAIKRNGRHLMELLNDILDLSKVEAGMLQAELIRVSPGGMLRDAVDSSRVRSNERGLTLELIHDGPLPATIESDPTRLRQILLNLISNAVKFTEQGGVRVTARLLASEHLLEVEVADTGIGIAAEREEHLFEPFTQADTSVTRQYGGTGLGLTITKRLVELLGGSLRVQSQLGVGSTFTFTVATGSLDQVPMADPDEVRPTEQVPSLVTLKNRRVLVVDDRRDMRYLLQTYLEEAGAECMTAANGSAAIAAVVKNGSFDAIVLDMQMPEMDGYEAAKRLRALGYRGKLLALTASAMKGDRERCIAAGCDEYLSKPVDRVLLFRLIARDASADAPSGVTPETQALRRVLIVDDNTDAADVLGALLERGGGIQARTANTGAEAVQSAEEFEPHAVILDLGLPDIDGYAVLEHLKQMPHLR